MNQINDAELTELVRMRFKQANIDAVDVKICDFPDESIILVRVIKIAVERAIEIGNDLDSELANLGFSGFVTIKPLNEDAGARIANNDLIYSLTDDRITQLANLLLARSRTSEIQPSLTYIRDARASIDSAISSRHHLIFGRRGSGKTALLAETKNRVESQGDLTIWLNAQSHRHDSVYRFFVFVCNAVCDALFLASRQNRFTVQLLADANQIVDECQRLLAAEKPVPKMIKRIVPTIQKLVRRMTSELDGRLFIFIDDLHYIDRSDQPILLDLLHGCVRDCNSWLKIATIQHLTHWFDSTRQIGLQSGHDASHIDLDLSLQDAAKAKEFLERILHGFAEHAGIKSYSRLFAKRGALDRLVIASGAVPRDYLMLCSSAIQIARLRSNARTIGVQDINQAAGDAKQKKIDELEDDAASSQGDSRIALSTLEKVKRFCLETKACTFFRVDFEDKDTFPKEYGHLQLLTDLRLVHLIEASLSDERVAGRKSEVFLLDLSQFAGQRLKRKLTVLDLLDGSIVLKQTGSSKEPRIGNTPNRKLEILRRGPLFSLSKDLV